MLDSDIAVLGPAERLEFLAKCNDAGPHFGIILVIWMQECDAPHALSLLRPRRERPRRRAAEQRDELAPFHLTEMHPIPHGAGSTSQDIGSETRAIGEP